MTDVAVDTLRLRGPAARRLARVAATVLPRALERALADVGDVVVDRVVVALDVADHDDETLAVLWADAVRAGVLAAGPGAPSRSGDRDGRGRREAPGARPPADRARAARGRADPAAAARDWLASPEPGRRLPPALLALGDPRTAAAVRERLPAAEWTLLLRRLAAALDLPTPGSGAAEGSAPAPPGPPGPVDPVRGDPVRGDPAHGHARGPARPEGQPPPEAPGAGGAAEREVLTRLALLAELADEDGGDLPPAGLTRAAGLVLLYPWLGDHCRRAEDLHPDLDPVDVREAALAAVVDPDDPAAADDPLVRLLAGRPDPLQPLRRTRVPLPALAEVAGSAAGVLASFAALLPGFERSSEVFVRHSWIARSGVLDTDRDPVLLTAATHPLDVLLPLLPYPVGLLKLPWSPPLTVRFR
ncbi:contractile injection system tape measure protein [Kocuria sp. M1R5S2]|uniref:contractile injection system tape measure protein n=1 Tax=Kocuria rhizosphaerae TaxID=3376285 RepID=UPI003788597E